MNLFFYPDDSEILETSKSKFKFQVFPSQQDRKTNSSVCFFGGFMARQFCFEIYWPLENLNFTNAPSIIIFLHCVVEGSLFGNFLHATITGSFFFYDCALLNAKFNYPGTYVPLGSTWLSNQGTLHSGEFHHFFHTYCNNSIMYITEIFASICLHASSHPLRFLCTILWYNVETRIVMRFSIHSSKFPNTYSDELKHIEIVKRLHV